ncbi:DUF2787 domain-containing protein [Vibrio sp. S11_S32]|uniref:DUF2787 family protein n=1 Tax=Vibrio sp. S11_S32 TaxID=2720225 RepID=UPI0016813A74|nr:DUF2787 family protein [Vibrio sp. S11_S32]MBD1576788.1 DUF2787 domain-containing protein [Vibrio sp. S11_S32]
MNQFVIESELLPVSYQLSQALEKYVEREFCDVRQDELVSAKALTFHFRDSSYNAEDGGFHPVEIRLTRTSTKCPQWTLAYVTTFAYIGNVYPELERNLDFDCVSNRCLVHPYIQWASIKDNSDAIEMYQLWESSFLTYLNSQSYDQQTISVNE